MQWLLNLLFSNSVPDIFGILFTIPAVALYIRGNTKKRFCTSCQRPIDPVRHHAAKPPPDTGGLIIIEGD